MFLKKNNIKASVWPDFPKTKHHILSHYAYKPWDQESHSHSLSLANVTLEQSKDLDEDMGKKKRLT